MAGCPLHRRKRRSPSPGGGKQTSSRGRQNVLTNSLRQGILEKVWAGHDSFALALSKAERERYRTTTEEVIKRHHQLPPPPLRGTSPAALCYAGRKLRARYSSPFGCFAGETASS